MTHHISNLGDITINWVEDQPVIRDVRMQMEQDGLIKNTIDQLQKNGKTQLQKNENYTINGESKNYICSITALSDTDPNHPKYRVAIKPTKSTLEWDAIGDIYVGNTPEWLKE